MPLPVDFHIAPQPDGSSCGPTCLQALYRFHGDDVPIDRIVGDVQQLDDGGVLGVQLACHALRRGYEADIYTYNVQMFDPTWFRGVRPDLRAKLEAQAEVKDKRKLKFATQAYLEYLDLGGRVDMRDLSAAFVAELLAAGAPVLTGLSSTWLYGGPREVGRDPQDDDVAGVPQGHFVVLCGWQAASRHVWIADPLRPNPFSPDPVYSVDIDRLIASILLGIVTYDANLILLRPRRP
ncbi:MAG: C39 family peptidase [Planctomycetes bacterium]|nr:C39 family peptidase [Planctomycetota bacterium]